MYVFSFKNREGRDWTGWGLTHTSKFSRDRMCGGWKCIQDSDFNLWPLSQVGRDIDYQNNLLEHKSFIRVPNWVAKCGNVSSRNLCWKGSRTWWKELLEIYIFEVVQLLAIARFGYDYKSGHSGNRKDVEQTHWTGWGQINEMVNYIRFWDR